MSDVVVGAAAALALSLPSACPGCQKEADYSALQGAHFCNFCGKKVLKVGESASTPAKMPPRSPVHAPQQSPAAPAAPAAADPTVYSTPARAGSKAVGAAELDDDAAAADDDDAVVTFKHAMQSPPPSGMLAPRPGSATNPYGGPLTAIPPPALDFDTAPTPLPPSRTQAKMPAASPQPVVTAHAPAPVFAPVPAPAPTLAAPAPATAAPSSPSTQAQLVAAARQAMALPTPKVKPTTLPGASSAAADSTTAFSFTAVVPPVTAAPASSPVPPAALSQRLPASPTPSPLAQTSPSHSANGSGGVGGDTISLTREEFDSLESNIRAEVLAAQAAEAEILSMEFDSLERNNARLEEEKREMQRTMEEMMDSYAKLVDEANARKNDYTAQLGILETELQLLRSQHQSQKSELASLRTSHTRLQSELDETLTLSNEQITSLERLQGENDNLRASYDKLRVQAQEKLAAASQEYRQVLQRAQDREAAVEHLQAELEQESTRAMQAEELSSQLRASAALASQRLQQLEGNAEAARTESLDLRAQVRTLTQTLTETKSKMEEAQQVGQRYKEQILEHRERAREMEDLTLHAEQLQQEQDRMAADVDAMSKENQQLKSQLFDAFQTEKALRAQMQGMGGSSSSSGDSALVSRLQGELAALQSALATKDNEHKELMAICTDLISQVETLKAQQGS